jgi:hypothetical protein
MSLRKKAGVGRDGSKKDIEPIERPTEAATDKERTRNVYVVESGKK